jgi:hypothetical protein
MEETRSQVEKLQAISQAYKEMEHSKGWREMSHHLASERNRLLDIAKKTSTNRDDKITALDKISVIDFVIDFPTAMKHSNDEKIEELMTAKEDETLKEKW